LFWFDEWKLGEAMMIRSQMAVVAVMFGAFPAMAQEIDCTNPELQIEMTFCAEREWNIADAELNDVYEDARGVMADIDAGLPKDQQGAVANLRDAQRAWVTFRDKACAAEGFSWHGGSGEPMVIYLCRARLTNSRISDLRLLVEGS
jgi:uncharacterized protein YecT (DUF1311 family)